MNENFGLTGPEWETIQKLLIEPLKAIGAKVWVFGSRAEGSHHRFSDLDVLYEIPDGRKIPLSVLSEMNENLIESKLPIKVDIVDQKAVAVAYLAEIVRTRRAL